MNGEEEEMERLTVHGHLVYLCAVILLNVTQDAYVIVLSEVDGHAFASITTRASNPNKSMLQM